MAKRDFEKLLLETIDEVLSSLGESLKQATYRQLDESFNVKKEDIPCKIGAFAKGIEKIFGPDANDLEFSVLDRLYEKLGESSKPAKSGEFSFIRYLSQARGREYYELVKSMQSGLAIFHLENPENLDSFRLIAVNTAAAKIAGAAEQKLPGKSFAETYPEVHKAGVPRNLMEVIRSGKAKNLGEFHFKTEVSDNLFSIAAFSLSNNCIGLVFKSVSEQKHASKEPKKSGEEHQDVTARMDEWRWEPDVQWRHVYSSHSRATERWIRKKVATKPRPPEYFSIIGKEFLEGGDLLRARVFLRKAEEMYWGINEMEKAFENASLRIRAFVLEEKVKLQEYFAAVEEYFERYSHFSADEYFIENLAYYHQWEGYRHCEERGLNEARAHYAKAEETFLRLKKKENALFNAAQLVLTYRVENNGKEYVESAEKFFEDYIELSTNRHYKEVNAHYCVQKADECKDPNHSVEFLGVAEKLFLEIGQKKLAFENACRKIDLCWLNVSSKDDQRGRTCFDMTDDFFEQYQDFSEHERFTKILAKYYLFQARVLVESMEKYVKFQQEV